MGRAGSLTTGESVGREDRRVGGKGGGQEHGGVETYSRRRANQNEGNRGKKAQDPFRK